MATYLDIIGIFFFWVEVAKEEGNSTIDVWQKRAKTAKTYSSKSSWMAGRHSRKSIQAIEW
jgi:hypothetical protein